MLTHLHGLSPPIVHRDVKPSNVMRRRNGTVVLIDFDMVRDVLRPQGGSTMAVGTPGYAPLEQLVGQAVPATDLYALGATLVALLSRKDPVTMMPPGENRLDFRDHVRTSDGMARVLERLLEPDVTRRYRSASDVLADLDRLERAVAAVPIGGDHRRAVVPGADVVLGDVRTVGAGSAGLAIPGRPHEARGGGPVDLAPARPARLRDLRWIGRKDAILTFGGNTRGFIVFGINVEGVVAVGVNCAGVVAVGVNAFGALLSIGIATALGALAAGAIAFSATPAWVLPGADAIPFANAIPFEGTAVAVVLAVLHAVLGTVLRRRARQSPGDAVLALIRRWQGWGCYAGAAAAAAAAAVWLASPGSFQDINRAPSGRWVPLRTGGIVGDMDAFDPVANLPWASAVAREWAADSVLTRLDASDVKPDGTVDVDSDDDAEVDYRFFSRSLYERYQRALETGASRDDCGEFRIWIEDGGARFMKESGSCSDLSRSELPIPPCSVPQAIAALRSAGVLPRRPHYEVTARSDSGGGSSWTVSGEQAASVTLPADECAALGSAGRRTGGGS